MSILKSDFICCICQMVLNDPVTLPCTSDICSEHLRDGTAKNGTIRCMKCEKDFDVPQRGFTPNLILSDLLASELHLSEEEKSIKRAIQDQILKLIQIQHDVKQTHIDMEITSFQHFTEIRRKIDLQREELKAKIDEIALKLVDQAKERENAYKLKLEQTISVIVEANMQNMSQILAQEFRNPVMLNEHAKRLQMEHEQHINEFQARINEYNLLGMERKSLEFNATQEFQADWFGSFSIKNGLIACTLANTIKMWQLESNEFVAIDGNKFASGSKEGINRIWSSKNPTCLKTLIGLQNGFIGMTPEK